MSQRDSGVNRQHSLETGLTQAIRPMLICASESSVSVKNQQGSDQLSVPQTTESRMAKMKKKISSPLLKRRNPSDGVTVVGNKTFGVSIDDLLGKSDGCEVPPVVTTIVEFLEKHGLSHEGIFRISGNYKVVESLKATFDKDGEADLEQVGDVMAVAGLLKLFLRELPDPLIPQNLTAEFIKIHQAQKGDSGSLSEMKSLLEKLPSSNYQLLKYLCKFLVKVSMKEENNKMSSKALSIIFGPNLFRCKDGIEGLREQGHTNAIVCKFIEEFDALFEVSPYAPTEIFRVQEAKSNDSVLQLARKYHKVGNDKPESSASDEESSHLTGDKDRTDHKDDGPTYATVKKPKKSLHLSTNVSSSTEDSGMYVRSVSPSWNTEHSDSGLAQESPKTPEGKEIVQKVINDTIKEHLFGPELTSTDDNSPHSPESGDEGPPLPSRNYGEDETGKQRRRRRRNNKNQKQESDTSAVVEKNEREKNLINTVEFLETEGRVKARQLDKEKVTKPVKKRPKSEGYELFEREAYVIGVDNNSNNILSSTFPGSKGRSFQHKQDQIVMDDKGSYEEILTTSSGKDALSMVKRNSEMLGSLTQGRAPPPKNRRSPSLKKRKETRESFTSEQEFDKVKQTKPLVHPLVDEAKSKGKVRTTPPKSPRSGRSPRMQPSASSPRQEGDVDQVDSSPLRPRKDVLTKQYKKKHHGSPIVPPLELYKLQQQDSLPDYAQLSPRERYDGLSTEEALLSPRTRPLTVDTRTIPHECPPSPPHQQVEHSWFERRVSGSPKEEITIKQLTKAISQLKKRIREFEDAFEEEHLRRPSQSEKAPIKKFVTELGRARKQLKELKERAKDEAGRLNETVPPMGSQGMKSSSSEPLLTTTPVSIEHSLESSLKRLKEKREDDGRPEEVELMGREQLQDEKLAVQKALLQHESVFGRPSNKRDKDLMRPLYDRYRNIKRKLAMSSSESPMKVVGNRPRTSSVDRLVSDLAPIHEDALLHSPSGGSPSRMTQSLPITGRGSPRSRKAQEASFMDTLDGDDDGLGDTIQDTMTISDAAQLREDAKFHEMTQDELSEQLELKRKEKKKLRKKLKKFEDEFFEKAGRRIQREDRGDMEPDYHEYKLVMEYGRGRKMSKDGWVEERCLGSGSFGTVMLYENKITKEQVALKRCRLDLNSRNRKRWQQEVDIMKRLDHPNLVSARDVPPPLDVKDDELPLLAMEFCSGGDLRKVLNSPESCCGLRENTVLRIASDIAAAVEFLHGHRIIHRDIKPENIVISHMDKKVVYKLIDLGYAKELDQGSLASTFVGTLKYLAPELLDRVQYTKTVDYWSLGTILFECITGMRPFLPELSPVQWHHEIQKKDPKDICAYFDVKGEIQFSSVLPTPNSLCRQLQEKFVILLRLLLLWNPKERGGSTQENGKKECYDVLEKIMKTMVVHVFSVSTSTMLSFEVFPNETIEDLQVKLYELTEIDKEDQELLAYSGQTVDPTTPVMDICKKSSQEDEDCALFLLPTNIKTFSTARPIHSMPPTVKGMVTEPKTVMSYEELKRAFAQGVKFCQEQRKINRLLMEGFRAVQISLLHLNSKLGQLKDALMTELHKLEAKVDFFKLSLQKDLECYAENISILKNDKILRGWKRAQKKVESLQNDDVTPLKDLTSSLQSKVLELQKSPYSSGTPSKSKLDGMYDQAVQLYEDLRQSDRRPSDSQKMVAVILPFLAQREKLHKDIFAHLSKVISCKKEIRGLMTRLQETKSKLVEQSEDLAEMQRQRQVDLWKLVQSKKQRRHDRRRTSSGSYSSLSSLTSSCCSPDSIVLMEESCKNFEKFAEELNKLKIDQMNDLEALEWDFLEDASDCEDTAGV